MAINEPEIRGSVMAEPTKEELEMMMRMILGDKYDPDFDPRKLGKREDAYVGSVPSMTAEEVQKLEPGLEGSYPFLSMTGGAKGTRSLLKAIYREAAKAAKPPETVMQVRKGEDYPSRRPWMQNKGREIEGKEYRYDLGPKYPERTWEQTRKDVRASKEIKKIIRELEKLEAKDVYDPRTDSYMTGEDFYSEVDPRRKALEEKLKAHGIDYKKYQAAIAWDSMSETERSTHNRYGLRHNPRELEALLHKVYGTW
jgi:hypothetical protein